MNARRLKLSLSPLLLLALAAPASSARADTVESVVVYADRAQVTRKTTASCVDGTATARFVRLPVELDERTLRASATGSRDALAVTTRRIPIVELDASGVSATERDRRIAELKAEQERLGRELRGIDDETSSVATRLDGISAYGVYFQGIWNRQLRDARPDTKRWTGALDTLQRERTELFRTQVDLHAKRRVVSRKLDVIQRRLARLQPLAQVETREAEVVAKCRKGKVVVQLSYVVGGATWRPEYDLRYDARSPGAGKGKVSLTVSAVIEQRTGEDWADAKVALSTAKPRLGARAPQPAALWIDGGPVDEPDVLVQATERREKLATGKGRADSGAPRAASLDDRGQSFLLELPHRATVRADGRPYWFPVDRTRGDAESAFIAVPKLSGHVYRVVRLDNPAPYPLLAGTAHIHRGDTYVGDVAIEYRAPGEPLEVSLGVDSDIRLERIDLVRKDKKGTWLSSDNHMERAYRTVLRSNAKGRRTIELRERLPVSKAEDVRVELDRKRTTRGFVLDAHRGFVTWKVDLGAGKTSRSDLVYAIHVPKSWKLRGRP